MRRNCIITREIGDLVLFYDGERYHGLPGEFMPDEFDATRMTRVEAQATRDHLGFLCNRDVLHIVEVVR